MHTLWILWANITEPTNNSWTLFYITALFDHSHVKHFYISVSFSGI